MHDAGGWRLGRAGEGINKGVRRSSALLVGAIMLSCGGIAGPMRDASRQSCADILSAHDAIARNGSYATQPVEDRERYELRVAQCDMRANRPEAALALARGWSNANSLERDQLVARAEAVLRHDNLARAALEAVRDNRRVDPTFFVDYEEFRRYAQEDWFLGIVLNAWAVSRSVPINRVVTLLVKNVGGRLVSLPIAAADPTSAAGQWGLWTGVVRDARLDRAKDETVLFAEGADVKRELRSIDRKVVSVRTEARPAFFGGLRETDSTPKYQVDRTYEEVFVPNGRTFVVRYPRAKDSLVEMHGMVAFGRYEGHGSDGRPVLNAIVVFEREAKESTTTHGD